ncbi:7070_t:CDS:1, partial [Scutellospora calospora]
EYEMPDINLKFIIRSDEIDGIFTLSVDNGKSVEFLKNKIRTNQRNLNEFDLYWKNFSQSSNALVGTLKNPITLNKKQGELMNPNF